jgi:hypothetical protein
MDGSRSERARARAQHLLAESRRYLMTRNFSVCANYPWITFARPNAAKENLSAHRRLESKSPQP